MEHSDGRSAAALPASILAAARVSAAERLISAGAGDEDVSLLCELATRLLGAPKAQVSLLGRDQVIMAGAGLPAEALGVRSPLEDSLCTVTAAANAPLIVPDARDDDRVCALPPVSSGQVSAYLGVPLRDHSGAVVGALCVYDSRPRAWSATDAELLSRLAHATSTELEYAATSIESQTSRARLDLVLEAGETGLWEIDLSTGQVTWDARCAALFGFDSPTDVDHDSVGQVIAEYLHPDDRVRVEDSVNTAILTGGRYDVEYRILTPSGEERWHLARGRVIPDAAGNPVKFTGAVVDVTASRTRAQEEVDAARRSAALAQVATRLATAVTEEDVATVLVEEGLSALGSPAGSLGVMKEDGTGLRGYLLGYGEEIASQLAEVPLDLDLPGVVSALTGDLLLVESPEDVDRYRHLGPALEATDTRSSASVGLRVDDRLLGSVTVSWREFRKIRPEELELFEALAAQVAQALLRVDAAQQRDLARLEEKRSRQRLELIAEATRSLAGTLDVTEAVGHLAQLLVPRLADWCIVTLAEEGGKLRDVGAAHRDPSMQAAAERYAALRHRALQPDSFVNIALGSGEQIVIDSDATKRIQDTLALGEAQEALGVLAPASVGFFPLNARARRVGLISLYRNPDRAPLDAEDVRTAMELADRAALALDNAHLYSQQRLLAEELQRSLLTAPPEPDHAQIVVRYQPAAQEAQVGGDWYDAFIQPEGATTLVIGDVVGHDTRAAAAMGQVRGLLRGIAYTTGAGPAEVLSRLDQALAGLLVGTIATAVVMRVEQSAEDREQGISRLRWANAGHPPPVVLNPDGSTTRLQCSTADLLLGIYPEVGRSEHELVVERGSTVLLYTDGLVERRGQSIDDGIDQLCGHLEDLASSGLDDVCDEVIRRMLPGEGDDDIALVAVRLHPQDRPRPPEAGPTRVPPGVPDDD